MIERMARVTAPAALALFTIVGALTTGRSVVETIALAGAVLTVAAGLVWRGASGWPLVGGLVLATLGIVLASHGHSANLGWFGICVIAGWGSLRAPSAPALLLGGGLIAILAGQWLTVGGDPGWGAWIAGTVFTTVACIFARRQRELAEQLRAAQADLAERVRAQERARVAGEVHDVIGHALTVSLLHISSARLALDEDSEQARTSLDEAERLARASLEEVRTTVGLLRADDPARVAPMPTASDIGELVESFRRAGTQIALHVDGDLSILGATRGLAAYRIVQESLTNAARHGDDSPVEVRIDVADGSVTVTVVNGGARRTGRADGNGLPAMRERAEAIGGRLLAGPQGDRWRVEAVLPA